MSEYSHNGRFMKGGLYNAHLSYKGKSIIVDYEHCIHDYDYITKNCVPCSIYPYKESEEYSFDVKLDPYYKKVNIEDLIHRVDELLEAE